MLDSPILLILDFLIGVGCGLILTMAYITPKYLGLSRRELTQIACILLLNLMNDERAILIGHYTESSWNNSTRGRVYDIDGISPSLCAGMGGGGNIVPTMLFMYEK